MEKLKLDNAATIYPNAMTKKWQAIGRVTAFMKEDVDVKALKAAVRDLAPRFPSVYVRLKKELFWDCFVPATDFDVVEKVSECPCRMMKIYNSEKPLFRILYNKNEIHFEFFHSISDGAGSFVYLKALILRYLENCGKDMSDAKGVMRADESHSPDEISDDFVKIYQKGVSASRKDTDAYQIPLPKKEDYLSVTEIRIPIDDLKSVAKSKYDCTVTQYVATVYAMALLDYYKKDKDNKRNNPVKLSVPVNLRPYWDSSTIRNFSSYVTINVTPSGDFTFESVLKMLKDGMKEKIHKDALFGNVCQNVADAKMLISRYSPLILKRLVMKQAFRMYGEKKYTSTISSVGFIKLPPALESEVDNLSVTLGATWKNRINCTVLGYRNTLSVNISSVSTNHDVENYVIDFIKSHGIPATVYGANMG